MRLRLSCETCFRSVYRPSYFIRLSTCSQATPCKLYGLPLGSCISSWAKGQGRSSFRLLQRVGRVRKGLVGFMSGMANVKRLAISIAQC